MIDLVYDEVPGLLFTEASAAFSRDREYRYRLQRTWDPEGDRCLFVMLNPSTADAFTLDPTIQRCLKFAHREGCGMLDVVNLFALRSTDPRALYSHPDPVGPANLETLASAIYIADLVVCGWGAHASKLAESVADQPGCVQSYAEAVKKPLWCLGVTAAGDPKHPLARGRSRIPDDQPLIPYAA